MPSNAIVRCKFKCMSILEKEDEQSVSFEAVMKSDDGTCENSKFFKWTPSGILEFNTVNKNVKFEAGKEYYLDITLALPIEG